MSPENRPEFCQQAQCPHYRYGTCELNQWAHDWWPTKRLHDKVITGLNTLSQQNPRELIAKCTRTLYTIK